MSCCYDFMLKLQKIFKFILKYEVNIRYVHLIVTSYSVTIKTAPHKIKWIQWIHKATCFRQTCSRFVYCFNSEDRLVNTKKYRMSNKQINDARNSFVNMNTCVSLYFLNTWRAFFYFDLRIVFCCFLFYLKWKSFGNILWRFKCKWWWWGRVKCLNHQ